MKQDSRIFDDLAGVMGGALGVLGGLREQMQAEIRACVDRLIGDMDVVTREEYEAVLAMAAKARAGQEALEKRLTALERKLKTQPKKKKDTKKR